MKSTPIIETQRLILRKFNENDVEALFLILSDKEGNTFLPWYPLESMKEAEKHLQEHYLSCADRLGSHRYAICLKTDNVPIGYIRVSDDERHNLVYAIRRDFWNQGIATEAGKALIEHVKKEGMPYITAVHDFKNLGGGAVIKKLGMHYQYSYEERWMPKGILVIFRMYQLNLDGKEEYIYKKYWDTTPVHFIERCMMEQSHTVNYNDQTFRW